MRQLRQLFIKKKYIYKRSKGYIHRGSRWKKVVLIVLWLFIVGVKAFVLMKTLKKLSC